MTEAAAPPLPVPGRASAADAGSEPWRTTDGSDADRFKAWLGGARSADGIFAVFAGEVPMPEGTAIPPDLLGFEGASGELALGNGFKADRDPDAD